MRTQRTRLIICAVLVAVVGLASALLIYLTAGPDRDPDENVQTIVVDGKTFRIPLASTKTYRRDLQRFGGGAAVLSDDLERWIGGLWHGRSLAVTVAWITAFVSLGLFAVARLMPYEDADLSAPGDDHAPGGGA
jgi:hypothetical protein